MMIPTGYEKRDETRISKKESKELAEFIKNSPITNKWWMSQIKVSEKGFYTRLNNTVNFTFSEAEKIKEIAEITKSL